MMKCASFCLVVMSAASVGSALAQNHISATTQCSKQAETTGQPVEVGDRPGHYLLLNKLTDCTYTNPPELAGLKAKTMSTTVAVDGNAAKYRDEGYAVMTMENGDKAYARIQGTGTSTQSGPTGEDGTWYFTGGTGKLKGLKGKGTYKAAPDPSGGGSSQMEGEYTLPGAGDAAKK